MRSRTVNSVSPPPSDGLHREGKFLLCEAGTRGSSSARASWRSYIALPFARHRESCGTDPERAASASSPSPPAPMRPRKIVKFHGRQSFSLCIIFPPLPTINLAMEVANLVQQGRLVWIAPLRPWDPVTFMIYRSLRSTCLLGSQTMVFRVSSCFRSGPSARGPWS